MWRYRQIPDVYRQVFTGRFITDGCLTLALLR